MFINPFMSEIYPGMALLTLQIEDGLQIRKAAPIGAQPTRGSPPVSVLGVGLFNNKDIFLRNITQGIGLVRVL
jgi:hypothetical protein